MSELNRVDTTLLEVIAGMKDGKAEGAFNIRKDSGCAGRVNTENVTITTKTDKPGIDIRFVEEEGPSPIHHPNTAVLEVSNDNHSIELTACSIGGGSIEIRQFVIDNITVQPAGPLPIIVYIDHGKKHPNAVELTGVVEKIAPFYRKQSLKGPINDIYEFDIKNYMSAATIQQIEKQFKNVICL